MNFQTTTQPEIKYTSGDSKFTAEKILGYFLLIIGLVIIIVSALEIYFVYTGTKLPVKVFSLKSPSIPLPKMDNLSLPDNLALPEGFNLPKNTQPQEIKLISDKDFNRLINMSVYYFLMSFLASTGVRISSIGVKLIKDLKVNIKGN